MLIEEEDKNNGGAARGDGLRAAADGITGMTGEDHVPRL